MLILLSKQKRGLLTLHGLTKKTKALLVVTLEENLWPSEDGPCFDMRAEHASHGSRPQKEGRRMFRSPKTPKNALSEIFFLHALFGSIPSTAANEILV